ncbi:MAG TPA: SDR family oxidoreductase [Thermoleophilaceae bacterium]|nr:SDR family oxidoreductase [Thermoleophilaceae bacterium]
MSKGFVLITGTSSGIGEACARHLAGLGFNVFAGVRKQEDADRVAGDRIEPVIIDVTDDASVAAAAETIRTAAGNAGLAGLVNNAGIAVAGPLEFVDIAEFQQQLEVNVTGVLRTTQAMLPELRKARGRIVNISSIGGRVAVPLVGPYAASKFALEGMSDSLRRELRPWGMHVSLIEPGAVATPIWDKGVDQAVELERDAPPEVRERYGEVIDAIRKQSEKNRTEGVPPQEVAEAVAHALTADKPKTRYLVGRDAKMRAPAATVLPDRAMDAVIARALGQRKAD